MQLKKCRTANFKITAVQGVDNSGGAVFPTDAVSACGAMGKDGLLQSGSLSQPLQCCHAACPLLPGKAFLCSGLASHLLLLLPRQRLVCPRVKLSGCPTLTWTLLLEHSRGWSLCSQAMDTRTFSASLLSCVLGCTLPLKPHSVLQSFCILLSFISVSGLFHLPGNTLALHFSAFYYFPLMPTF